MNNEELLALCQDRTDVGASVIPLSVWVLGRELRTLVSKRTIEFVAVNPVEWDNTPSLDEWLKRLEPFDQVIVNATYGPAYTEQCMRIIRKVTKDDRLKLDYIGDAWFNRRGACVKRKCHVSVRRVPLVLSYPHPGLVVTR